MSADDRSPEASYAAFASDALSNQVILVTGGGTGIGAATAVACASVGADVGIAFHTSGDRAEAVAERVRGLGRRCETFRADVSDAAEARNMVAECEKRFGRIDGLVNNAGIMPSSPFLEVTDEVWDQVMRTDLYSVFACSQAVLPGMVERGSGAIVNISSRLGQVGFPGVSHYTAAKAGVMALTKSLAKEFGQQGIRINAVAPGVTNTDMGRGVMDGEVGRKRMAELPLGRFGEPEEVAAAVVFLLSKAGALFVGQTLNPNAGGYMP